MNEFVSGKSRIVSSHDAEAHTVTRDSPTTTARKSMPMCSSSSRNTPREGQIPGFEGRMAVTSLSTHRLVDQDNSSTRYYNTQSSSSSTSTSTSTSTPSISISSSCNTMKRSGMKHSQKKSTSRNRTIHLSRHQLKRRVNNPQHQSHQSHPVCTSTSSTDSRSYPSASASSSSSSFKGGMTMAMHPPAKRSSGILRVRTQDDSLRASYGSFSRSASTIKSSGVSTNASYRAENCDKNNASFDFAMPVKNPQEACTRVSSGPINGALSMNPKLLSKSTSASNVSFHKVCVREYARCIGDNVPSEGPPISIGWKFRQKNEHTVDEYENVRTTKRKRNSQEEYLPLNVMERVELLSGECGNTYTDIIRATCESSWTQQQRIQTSQRHRSADQLEEFVESARKSLKNVSLKKTFRRKGKRAKEEVRRRT